MLPLFAGVLQFIKKKPEDTDNPVFKLHYKYTATFLIGCSIVLTAKQLVGEPISCIGGKNIEIPQQALNDYCWIQTTYTVAYKEEIDRSVNRRSGISAGVLPAPVQGESKHHSYYQWVCLVLFIQALCFYLPKYIWNTREGHLVRSLTVEVNSPIPEDELKDAPNKEITCRNKRERKRKLKKERLGDLLTVYFLQSQNKSYFVIFVICEILNFLNVSLQMVFLNYYFLNREFFSYVIEIFRFMNTEIRDQHDDPMDIVFPKLSKCTFRYYGPGGSEQTIEALCVLPLNVVNEKIFFALWIWYILLLFLTGLFLIYRFSVICSKFMRCIYLRSKVSIAKRSLVRALCTKLDIGDWFVLCQLSNNVHISLFEDIIVVLYEEVCGNDPGDLKNLEMKESNKNSYNVAPQ